MAAAGLIAGLAIYYNTGDALIAAALVAIGAGLALYALWRPKAPGPGQVWGPDVDYTSHVGGGGTSDRW